MDKYYKKCYNLYYQRKLNNLERWNMNSKVEALRQLYRGDGIFDDEQFERVAKVFGVDDLDRFMAASSALNRGTLLSSRSSMA